MEIKKRGKHSSKICDQREEVFMRGNLFISHRVNFA